MSVKGIDIEGQIKKSRSRGRYKKNAMDRAREKNPNKNMERIGEIGKEISDLQRKKSMAATPEDEREIQEEIDRKKERFEKLKEEGRRKTRKYS